jgi:hypothetical protein
MYLNNAVLSINLEGSTYSRDTRIVDILRTNYINEVAKIEIDFLVAAARKAAA